MVTFKVCAAMGERPGYVCGCTQECAARVCVRLHTEVCGRTLFVYAPNVDFQVFQGSNQVQLRDRGPNSHFGGFLRCVRPPYEGVRPYTFK